uniref:Saccharopine dehydrogenase NADP binding domain-containing protein n=1 Tax=Heliothis virescens TaxID=7102 RepID=A0A2A4JJC6_HELVI
MEVPRIDLVIFGATGLTGKNAVIQLAKVAKKYDVGTWGIAGRSQNKLEALKDEVSQKTGEDLSDVKVIVADIGDEASLRQMCAQTKLLVNCCGPYRLYGEPVVKAAVDSKCHYIDVTGEPQFMELMQIRYDERAREAGVFVISACGWDSIPADMGVIFVKQNFKGTLNSVESYLSGYLPPLIAEESKERGVIGFGTYESIIYGMADQSELPKLKKTLFPEPLPKLKPEVKVKNFQKRDGEWYLPFPGGDESVVYRTQRYLHQHYQERPVQFQAYFKAGTFGRSLQTICNGVVTYTMAQSECTRKRLLDNPKHWSSGYVTKEGPTENVMNNTYFTFELVGKGWEQGANIEKTQPNKTVVAKVTGSNPAYGSAVVALIMSAVTLLKERRNMPENGGVITPGSAFQNTSLIERLNEHKLKFQIVSS